MLWPNRGSFLGGHRPDLWTLTGLDWLQRFLSFQGPPVLEAGPWLEAGKEAVYLSAYLTHSSQ